MQFAHIPRIVIRNIITYETFFIFLYIRVTCSILYAIRTMKKKCRCSRLFVFLVIRQTDKQTSYLI